MSWRATDIAVSVSAIVVSHNSAALLSQCLDALRGPDVETIVVDNASMDTSREVAALAGATVVPNPRNAGFAAACNLGVERASAPVVAFVNPDAIVAAAKLERAATWLVSEPRAGAAGLPHRHIGGERVAKLHRFPTLGRLLLETLGLRPSEPIVPPDLERVPVDWVAGSALLVRRDLYRRIGGMDESFFLYFEDVDLCRRVRDAGSEVYALLAEDLAIEHDERLYVKYHSAVKIYAWHRSCARYLEKHGSTRTAVRVVIAIRAILRFAFWTIVRVLRRVDARAFAERSMGYAATLRFCFGRPPPLPSEASPGAP